MHDQNHAWRIGEFVVASRHVKSANHNLSTATRTLLAGQFNWGGCLLKSNGGAQWSTSAGWKSALSCNRTSGPNCETNMSIRSESW